MRQVTSDGYYEEVRKGQIIPEGGLSELGTLRGVGPGLWGLPGISHGGSPTSENSILRLSEKPRTGLQHGPKGHRKGTFRPIIVSVYRPN
jgi:hypothetical protein